MLSLLVGFVAKGSRCRWAVRVPFSRDMWMASPRTPHRGPGLPGVVLGYLSAWVDGINELDGCDGDGESTWLELGNFL